MEIKKGDRVILVNIADLPGLESENWIIAEASRKNTTFYIGDEFEVTNIDKYPDGINWVSIDGFDFDQLLIRFEKVTESKNVPKSTNPVPPPPKQDSPTSPSHYKVYDIESIEMMIRIWGKQRVAEWCEITAMKYRLRAGLKGDASECLAKEKWYLAKWKELRDGE